MERKIGLAAFYNAIYKKQGFALAPHHYPLIMGLEDERIQNLLFLAGPGTGKSTLLDIVFPAWQLGHDPTTSIMAVSAGEDLPRGFMQSVMQIVQHDETFQKTFPTVKPDHEQGWSLGRGLYVTGHSPYDPDPTYKAVGITSKALTGMHCRIQILDDLHDAENAHTSESRQGVINKYYNTLMGRANPMGCRRIAAGRWWATDDVYQEWIKNGDWVVMSLPAVREGQTRLWFDVFVPKGLECVYTEKLEPEKEQDSGSLYVKYRAYYGAIDKTKRGFYWPDSPYKRKEYETIARRQPRTAAINYRGDMTGGGDSIFNEDEFRIFTPPFDLELGIQSPNVVAWVKAMKGTIEDAWDTALGQEQSTSLTAALTGLFVPCGEWHCGEDSSVLGPCDFHYDLYLIDALIKHLNFGELARSLRERFGKWHPRRVNIEEKQSGVSLLQTFKGTPVPVRGLKVPQGKVERAVNPVFQGDGDKPLGGGAASAQGWVKMGRVLYPAGADWIAHGPDGSDNSGLIKKICAFKGGTKASDEFDAFVHLVTRAIVMSGTRIVIGNAAQDLSDEQVAIAHDTDGRRQALNVLGELSNIAKLAGNPMHGMCIAPCRHYGLHANHEFCFYHERQTNSFGGCGDFILKR